MPTLSMTHALAPLPAPRTSSPVSLRLVEYDAQRRRLWIFGQRCHHGATGSLLALCGALLMVHDWKDRTIWFQPGRGTQP
ncbi:MAG TPA: hypothetical protein VFN48_05875 [Solirubrobacteraceae bacterium]|nr:hypothetical protein [Solirubrobacteraceae bacterium]